jgi:predicted ATPase/DNA-binding XRE family transcriptional regulator/Tfp pilus assembly protein PilF
MSGDPVPAFGPQLREHRRAAGLTQEQLAERAHLSVRAICDLERGVNRTARGATARLLADALCLTEETRDRFLSYARGHPFNSAASGASDRSLPTAATALVGRTRELATAETMFDRLDGRLLTLTGPGGVGKTRLAVEVADRQRCRFEAGVWFVPLAQVSDPDLVASAIAVSLDIQQTDTRLLPGRLAEFIHHRHLLMILDNFEHVLPAKPLIADLLARCPRLHVLVTSRAPLRLHRERLLPVRPLALPDPEPHRTPEQIEGSDAVSLFVQRTATVLPDFVLTAENAETIAAICDRLDGLPLAIELAAARSNVLAPRDLLSLLSNRLDLLTGGPRDAPPRLRTMRDAIAWSYSLLDSEEQAILRVLGVFSGSFSLAAAADVLQGSGLVSGASRHATNSSASHVAILDQLSSLVDKSLVQSAGAIGCETQLRLLETVREYALDELALHGETGAARRSHARYFLTLAETAAPGLFGAAQRECLNQIEREHDNIRAALSWALEQGEVEIAHRLCALLALFWQVRGHLEEGRRWCARALEMGGVSPRLRADVLQGQGMLAHWLGDYAKAEIIYDECLTIRRAIGDERGIALTLNYLGILAGDCGDHKRALPCYDESLTIRQSLGDTWGIANLLSDFGNVARAEGRDAEAARLYSESLSLFEEVGDLRNVAILMDDLGDLAARQGDYDRAVSLLEAAIDQSWALGYRQLVARALNKLGTVALAVGQPDRAEACHEESLDLQLALGDRRGIAYSLTHLAQIAQARGDVARAAALHRESLREFMALGAREGIAAGCEGLAIAAASSNAGLAAKLFGVAARVRETIGAPIPLNERGLYDLGVASARETLGETAFADAWSVGESTALDEALHEALAKPRVIARFGRGSSSPLP